MGGRSPLLDVSLAQARALESRLNEGEAPYRCYVGMRHWTPYIRETVARIRDDGIRRVVALCLTPYFSKMSVGAYFADLDQAMTAAGTTFEVERVDSWNDRRELIDAFAGVVRHGLEGLEAAGHPDPVVLFTAHSLPKRIMEEGDPYERELQEAGGGGGRPPPPAPPRGGGGGPTGGRGGRKAVGGAPPWGRRGGPAIVSCS